MEIKVELVRDKKELEQFIDFPFTLYKDDPYWVPPLKMSERRNFDPQKNPNYALSEVGLYLAYKGKDVVGRIAAIVNKRENELLNLQKLRFGWFDFIDDIKVSGALLHAAQEFGERHGTTEMEGPVGFSNLDKAAVLTEGFDEQSNTTTLYNFPYYAEHLRTLGLEEHTTWIEKEIMVPDSLPDRLYKLNDMIRKRYGLQTIAVRSKAEVEAHIPHVFEVVNKAYSGLHNFVPLTPEQQSYYTRDFLDMIDVDYISLIADKEGELVAFGFAIPSMVKALQKARGSLLPFGWWHLMRAFKNNDRAELILIGVLPEWQGKGATGLIFADFMEKFQRRGIKYMESNPEQESNVAVQALWSNLKTREHKARSTFSKKIGQ